MFGDQIHADHALSTLLPTRELGQPVPAWHPDDSYHDVVSDKLAALCDALGFGSEQRDAAIALMHVLLAPWGDRRIGTAPSGDSDITDEHFPVEFSVAFENGAAEIRVLFEAQADEFTPQKLWDAGLDVCETLERGCNVSLERFRRVADLFEPTDPTCRYALWHCVGFSRSGPPKFKVYLNPLAQGPDRAPAVVREALTRLGFSDALQHVFSDAAAGELRFFSLDLSSLEDARVKVYRVLYNSTPDEVSAWLRCVPSYDEQQVSRFWHTISGGMTHFTRLPISTYLSLDSRSPQPSSATIHFPVRSYARDDLEVHNRIADFMGARDMRLYDNVLDHFASRALSSGLGLQAYVAMRIHAGAPHTTVYLSPEAYHIDPPRPSALHLRPAC